MKSFYLFTAVFFYFSVTLAEQWALRARENYETIKVSGLTEALVFSGFTPTINFFYEKPYVLSYGLSLNPPLGSVEEKDDINSILGTEIKLWQVGGEIKYFPIEDLKGFVRGGLTYQLIDTKTSLDNIGGYGIYLGAGWEFPIFDNLLSLAPEVGYRRSEFRQSISADTFLVSIGVHFYKFAKK